MIKLIKLALIVLFLFNLSCSNKEVDNDIFLQYLKETFNEKDIIAERMFIILPCTSCSGCNKSVYSLFTQRFINNKDFTLIICDPDDNEILSPTLEVDNVKYDSLSLMADYDFGYGYPTCIIVRDNHVVNKYSITPEVMHWLVKFNPSAKNPK